jgi:hypothetical protein
MSFFQIIFNSIMVFTINTLGSGLFFLLFHNTIRRRISEWLQAELSEYIREQLTLTLEHADETAKTLTPLINAIIREAIKNFQTSQKEGADQMIKIPFLGKIPAPIIQALIQKFLGGNTNKENPFA